jgi:putative ABC transport system permease protein
MEIRPLLSALWRRRTGPLLVAAQVALSLAVLVNAAYIIAERASAISRPTGIDIDNIFWTMSDGYAADYNHAATVRGDLAYLNSLPGVIAAAATHSLPQTFSTTTLPFYTNPQFAGRAELGIIYMTSEKSIDALGLKLIAGRSLAADAVASPEPNFSAAFGKWAPEIVVTKAMADKLFPDGNALGKTVYVGLVQRSSEIVGIVEQMRSMPITGSFAPVTSQIVLVPAVPPGPIATYLVRTEPGRRDEVFARVEKELEGLAPGRFINRMEAYRATADRTRAPARANVIMLVVVAVFVVLISAVGIFGLAAFNVATRTKQIGARRALGARKVHILRYFLVENWLIMTAGIAIGCVLAVALGIRLSLLLQYPRLPLFYLIGGAVGLWLLGLAAALLPARRAAAISPAVATRTV